MFERPQTLDQALDVLDHGNWQILSGGTDFFPALSDRPPNQDILDISAIAGLRKIEKSDGFWRIGALVTWSDLIAAELPAAFDGLKQAGKQVGSIQIQNRATIAGNICNASPAADGLPPLLTLDAKIEICRRGNIRQIPIEEFVTGNRKIQLDANELVSAILIPENATKGSSWFLKLGSRKYLVISISMAAARIVCNENGLIETAAISVGACSLVAKRLLALEKQLVGQAFTTDIVNRIESKHLEILSPIDDIRASKSYRMDATLELVRRTVLQAATEQSQ